MFGICGAAGCFFLLGLLLRFDALALLFGGSGSCLFGLALGVGFGLDLLALCLFGVTTGLFFAFLGLLLAALGFSTFLQLAVGLCLAGLFGYLAFAFSLVALGLFLAQMLQLGLFSLILLAGFQGLSDLEDCGLFGNTGFGLLFLP